MIRRLWRWIATMPSVEAFATGYAVGLAKGQEQGLRIAGDLEQHAELSMRLNFDLLQERDALVAELRRVRMGE
jgi:hypothetical protein